MRLTDLEVSSITRVIAKYIGSDKAESRLFGSRVRDDLRGGDIDLLVICEDESVRARLSSKKHYILAEIKDLIGDQKIDLIITNRANISEDPFLKIILPESVVLSD